ncbi:MAG: glycerophosphodiester phosphodiesterase, partial [Cetobacterium sp.]
VVSGKTSQVAGMNEIMNNLIGNDNYLDKRKMSTENTIEDLKNSKKYKLGDVVEVLGFHAKGDGRHHKRKIEQSKKLGGVELVGGLFANPIKKSCSNLGVNGFVYHRGLSKNYPENTLIAYEKTPSKSVGWEIDPHYIADGNIWVNIHDMTLERTTNGTGNVQDKSYEYLRGLEITGGNFVESNPSMKIPTVIEIVATAKSRSESPIILFNSRTVIVTDSQLNSYIELLHNYKNGKIIFFRNSDESWEKIREKYEDSWFCTDLYALPDDDRLQELKDFGNVIIGIDSSVLTEDNIKKIKSYELPIMAFTVSSSSVANTLFSHGVDLILTDVLGVI